MLYFFHERKYIRNQVVYNEGSQFIEGVYFIKSGEFEVTKKVSRPRVIRQVEKQNEHLFNTFTSEELKRTLTTIRRAANHDVTRLKKVHICIMGENEVIGIEEVSTSDT